MRFRTLALPLVAALAASVALGAATAAAAPGCAGGRYGAAGYAYAGHQSAVPAHGIRARISVLVDPGVTAGHVAGWIGVAGGNRWLQVGIASFPGTGSILYVELNRGGRPVFTPLETALPVGASRDVAVVELAGRPGWWQVLSGGQPILKPFHLPGSSGWRATATAETWNGGRPVCNRFAYRFEQVAVRAASGSGWTAFAPSTHLQDRGLTLTVLAPRPTSAAARLLSAGSPAPFAFDASRL